MGGSVAALPTSQPHPSVRGLARGAMECVHSLPARLEFLSVLLEDALAPWQSRPHLTATPDKFPQPPQRHGLRRQHRQDEGERSVESQEKSLRPLSSGKSFLVCLVFFKDYLFI